MHVLGVFALQFRKPSLLGRTPGPSGGRPFYGSFVVRVLRGLEGHGDGEKRPPPDYPPHPPAKTGILRAPLSLRLCPHLCRIAECAFLGP